VNILHPLRVEPDHRALLIITSCSALVLAGVWLAVFRTGAGVLPGWACLAAAGVAGAAGLTGLVVLALLIGAGAPQEPHPDVRADVRADVLTADEAVLVDTADLAELRANGVVGNRPGKGPQRPVQARPAAAVPKTSTRAAETSQDVLEWPPARVVRSRRAGA
jgi:hypothetical protein